MLQVHYTASSNLKRFLIKAAQSYGFFCQFGKVSLYLRLKNNRMKLKDILLCAWMLVCTATASAENTLYRYRVQLKDKAQTAYSLDRPEEFLSLRSIERRTRQGLKPDSTDLPVCAAYIRRLEAQGGKFVSASKWNNTVLMQTADEQTAERFLANPFVKSVRKVWVGSDSVPERPRDRKKEVADKWSKLGDVYGTAADQIRIHRGDSLHEAGFRGQGMTIAVIDAGYYNVDAMKIFGKLRILGAKDFVNPSSDIYAEHDHGMKVLSCMAADKPHVMVGTAPEAAYWLLRTEDNDVQYIEAMAELRRQIEEEEAAA